MKFHLLKLKEIERERKVMQIKAGPASPCNKACIMDPATHLCKGCYRTIEEIVRWQYLSPEEKTNVLQLAEKRKTSIHNNNRPS